MIDSDLAELYGVETRILNQAVSRNKDRFPDDFMFQLNKPEWDNLKSQNTVSSSCFFYQLKIYLIPPSLPGPNF